MRWLKSLVTGGADELGWDDLIRRAAKAIAETAQYGARGAVAFPAEVDVVVVARAGTAEIARGFLERPAFDREIGAQLQNRCDCAAADLPLRRYEVEEGAGLQIRVESRSPEAASPWVLRVEGGDLDGQVLELLNGRQEIRFGRGPWHGGDRQISNDLVVAEDCPFVSRRAGRLLRSGHLLEVESLDQGDLLFVRRQGGETMRPARAASGRGSLREGDAIELADGGDRRVRLVLERQQD